MLHTSYKMPFTIKSLKDDCRGCTAKTALTKHCSLYIETLRYEQSTYPNCGGVPI